MNFIIKCDNCKQNKCNECIELIPIDSIVQIRLKDSPTLVQQLGYKFDSTIPCFCKHDRRDKLDYAIYKKVLKEVREDEYAMKLTDDIMKLIKAYGLI